MLNISLPRKTTTEKGTYTACPGRDAIRAPQEPKQCVRESYLSAPFCCYRRDVNTNTTVVARLYTGTSKHKLLWLHCGERIRSVMPFLVTYRSRSHVNFRETCFCLQKFATGLADSGTNLHPGSATLPALSLAIVDIHPLERCFRFLHVCGTHPKGLYCSLLPMLSSS